MQESQISNEKIQVTTEPTKTALKPYQKPTLFKMDDELTGVEGGADAVPESGCGLLS